MATLKICASIVLIALIVIASIEVWSVAGVAHAATVGVMGFVAIAVMFLKN